MLLCNPYPDPFPAFSFRFSVLRFSCLQTIVWLPVSEMFNVHTDVDAGIECPVYVPCSLPMAAVRSPADTESAAEVGSVLRPAFQSDARQAETFHYFNYFGFFFNLCHLFVPSALICVIPLCHLLNNYMLSVPSSLISAIYLCHLL